QHLGYQSIGEKRFERRLNLDTAVARLSQSSKFGSRHSALIGYAFDCLSVRLSCRTAMTSPPVSGLIELRRKWPHALRRNAARSRAADKRTPRAVAPRGQKCVGKTGRLGEIIRPGGALRSDLRCPFELPPFRASFLLVDGL